MSKRARPLSYDELFRYDLGLSSDGEREAIRRRAVDDPELRLTLSAIEEGDRAIDEAMGGAEPHRSVVPLPVEPRGTPPDIIEENDAFKVLVFRGPRTVQVVVQPRRSATTGRRSGVPLRGSRHPGVPGSGRARALL